MRFNKKVFLLTATALVLAGGIGGFFTKRSVRSSIDEEFTFSAKEVEHIQIETEDATVLVKEAENEEVKVTFTGSRPVSFEATSLATLAGNQLNIVYEESQRRWFNLDFHPGQVKVTVYLPEEQFQSLEATIHDGNVEVEQVQISEIQLSTHNGRVKMSDIVSENTTLETYNGRLSLENVLGTLSVKTNNGHIELRTDSIDRNIDFETRNGGITIDVAKEPENVTFITDSHNGRVEIFGESVGHKVFGDGEYTVRLTTHNGGIRVNR